MEKYQFWLHRMPGIGDQTIRNLLQQYQSAYEIYKNARKQNKDLGNWIRKPLLDQVFQYARQDNVEEAYRTMCMKGIHFVTWEHSTYPEHLAKLKNPPYGIYYLGELPDKESFRVAIIGSRECSEYGSYMARSFAAELAEYGVMIVSGMARGIDGISQQAAIAAGGKTYAVLGCGVDICYPKSNRLLYEETQKNGAVISTFPPGTQPIKQLFPERNRIVAGLSDTLLVVEARQKSGTFITVDMALDQGKEIYAIPGRLTDRLSDGCNMLIRQGAGIALTPADLIHEIEELRARDFSERIQHKETSVIEYLDYQPRSIDEIQNSMRRNQIVITREDLLQELLEACFSGRAVQQSSCSFSRI